MSWIFFLPFDVVLLLELQYKADMKKKIPNIPVEGCKPEISYPCSWQYKIIGTDRESIIDTVMDILPDTDHLLINSHTSSGGRYVSMNLELVVQSEEQRLSLYNQLVKNTAIKIVL